MTKPRSNRENMSRTIHDICAFLSPLDAFTESYKIKPNGRKSRFNFCHECLCGTGRDTPSETFFELGQCSSCDRVLPVCDPWLADLCMSLGVVPSPQEKHGIPCLRQPFSHQPLMPHARLLARLSQHIISRQKSEDE